MEADGLIAERLVGLAIGTDEQPLGLPPLLPLLSGETGSFEVVAGPGQTPTSSADGDPPFREACRGSRLNVPIESSATQRIARSVTGAKRASCPHG